MLNRIANISLRRNFFLFGARGTGKSTLLSTLLKDVRTSLVDLLDPNFFRLSPKSFQAHLEALAEGTEWVVLDEIQRSPELLNVVHRWISKSSNDPKRLRFALTGSSARKLKRGGANLLAGRASVFNLYPLTHREIPQGYPLEQLLKWGGLPDVVLESDPREKLRVLRAYTTTYLREEIAEEQLVRSIEPFQAFLSVAAQMNGKIVNYSAIAKDVGVSTTTVQTYFDILSDTLIAVTLPAYHSSIRKRQRSNPKIYLFDVGVVEALIESSVGGFISGSYSAGNRFEHFVFLEIYRLQSYRELGWRFSYLRTKDDAEIDLIIERPHQPTLLIEIKATDNVSERHAANLNRFAPDFKSAEAILISNDPVIKRFNQVRCIHWSKWLHEVFPVEHGRCLIT
jgi:predicted AAA+ superfamily ATPase